MLLASTFINNLISFFTIILSSSNCFSEISKVLIKFLFKITTFAFNKLTYFTFEKIP